MALSHEAVQCAAPLDAKERDLLQKEFHFSNSEMEEISAENYTLLDGYYLDGAFLLHDAVAHALEPEEVGVDLPTPTPLDRAKAAFAWVVREVRLADPTPVSPTPPQFALRRSSGTALERALVYLDLLAQLGAPTTRRRPSRDKQKRRLPFSAVWFFVTIRRRGRRAYGPAASSSTAARTFTSSIRVWVCRCRARTAKDWPLWRMFAETLRFSSNWTSTPLTLMT